MSRVQVKDLIRGFEDEFVIGGRGGVYVYENLYNKKLKEISYIEIVPRKIVEDIIAECDRLINLSTASFGNDGTLELTQDYYKGVGNCAKDIKSFALHFLEVFEEEGE